MSAGPKLPAPDVSAPAAAPSSDPNLGQSVEQRPRPTWDEYFMGFARLARTRATCIRRQVGAVIVRDRQILTTGYNGAPRGMPHADEVGCLRQRMGVPSGQRHEICRGLHAEQNAIIQAAYQGISVRGGHLYCTTVPCSICLKMIINAGITRVYYREWYDDALRAQIVKESGIELMEVAPSPFGDTEITTRP